MPLLELYSLGGCQIDCIHIYCLCDRVGLDLNYSPVSCVKAGHTLPHTQLTLGLVEILLVTSTLRGDQRTSLMFSNIPRRSRKI